MDAPEPSLRNIVHDQPELKWIFVGGKGGVGKTTTSCCLAIQLAKHRKKVLIISTDPAHNLSDAFRQQFNSFPTLVEGFSNLYAMEVDPQATSEEEGLALKDDSLLSDLQGSIPGIDEAMSFAEVMKIVNTMDYDVVVFDTAPTGHTLRLLQLPSMLDKALGKFAGLKGSMGPLFGQVADMLGVQQAGGEAGLPEMLEGKLGDMKTTVEKVNKQFKDPELTTFVCVCIPEFLSLYETERLVQELTTYEIDTHNIVINQIIFPEEVGSSKLLEARVKMQSKYIADYDDLYEDFHVVKMPLQPGEIRGPQALESFSALLLDPYKPKEPEVGSDAARMKELEAEVTKLKQRIAELEGGANS